MSKYQKQTPPEGYEPTWYYTQKYGLRARELATARTLGLKHVRIGQRYYYKEQELNDFYAGKYGLPEPIVPEEEEEYDHS